MHYKLGIIIALICFGSSAQTALYNEGNLRIHDLGNIGFHTNLINNGVFDENLGLAGFYSDVPLEVSGALTPILFDVEIATDGGVLLSNSVAVQNNTNFITGDFRTSRAQPENFYEFLQDAFYIGESDITKIDGYASMSGQQSFTFPVGDDLYIRPLILNSESSNPISKCAYFYENPNSPTTFPPFNTQIKARSIEAVSTSEFWRLEGSIPSKITLNWNSRSNLLALAPDVNNIVILGWNKVARQWISLGNSAFGGDLISGFITTETFVPDDFEVITFGSAAIAIEMLTLDNYYVSPNGDGVNDALVIPELEQSPNNSLELYDREGQKVFEMINYQDEFTGYSNIENLVVKQPIGLPEGFYYYIISMDDLGLNFQGFLFLER